MENLNYLMAAYSIIWIAIAAYIFIIAQKQRKLEEELEILKKEKTAQK